MGLAPIPVIVAANAKGNSADGSISRSALDDYFASMQSNLLILLRAIKINVAAGTIVDALGNSFTQKTGGVKNSSDSNFNGHETITFGAPTTNNPYTPGAGGIGIGTPPIAMPNSFSVVAGLRLGSYANPACLYGDGTSGNGGVGVYVTSSGALNLQVGGNTDSSGASPGLFPLNTTQVFWYSYDAATKIHRYGVNTTGTINSVTGAGTRTSQGTAAVCYPFGFYSGGSCGAWTFHRWALFGKAYMNGAVPADDQQFSGLISTYNSYI